jgi:serine/threonine protein kinase
MEPHRAQKILDHYKDRLEKAGIKIGENPEALGAGATGTAYHIGNNKVLKITKDRSEANACNRIKGKKLKNVYEIYDVFELDDLGVYVIHQELLAPLDPVVTKNWSKSYTALTRAVNRKWSLEEALDELEAEWEGGWGPTPEESAKPAVKEAFAQAYNGLKELEENRIIFRDFHYKNIMKRPSSGELVIIDLGVSRSPERAIDKLNEGIIREDWSWHMRRLLG